MIEVTSYSILKKFSHEDTGHSWTEWVPGMMIRDHRGFVMAQEPHARIVYESDKQPPWLVEVGGVSTCWMRYWKARDAFKAASRAVRYSITLGRKTHERNS